jgi:hypothetical protein
MKKYFFIFTALVLSSFDASKTLTGTWQFAGGVYNGKKEGATKGYSLRRIYNSAHYEAFLLEKGHKPEKYEAGDYLLKGDTFVDTETYSVQTSRITHIPIHYKFTLRHDTLTLKGTLPTGMRVEEYWKRVK